MTSWTVLAWARAAVVVCTTFVCRRPASSWAACSRLRRAVAELLGGVPDDADDPVRPARLVAPDAALGVGPAQRAVAAADAEVRPVVLAAVLERLGDEGVEPDGPPSSGTLGDRVSGRPSYSSGRRSKTSWAWGSICRRPPSRSQSKLPMRLSARIGSGWAGQSSGSDRALAPRSAMGPPCQGLSDSSSGKAVGRRSLWSTAGPLVRRGLTGACGKRRYVRELRTGVPAADAAGRYGHRPPFFLTRSRSQGAGYLRYMRCGSRRRRCGARRCGARRCDARRSGIRRYGARRARCAASRRPWLL